ncbi:MAG: glycosyltransferase [Anaerolineae bacterium]|nr:glycosyltransferase [Anaerolineae bacterium]
MRILHVIPSLGPRRGGPSQAAKAMCRELAALGMDVTIVASDDDGPAAHQEVPLNQPLVADGYTTIYFRRTAAEYTFSAPMIGWVTRHLREFDFVHAHALFSFAPALAAFAAQRHKVPYAITPHGILRPWGIQKRRSRMKQLSFNLVERQMLNGAAFIQVTSNVEADEIRAMGIARPIEVVYLAVRDADGIRDDQSAAWAEPDDTIRVLFLGRFDPVKGLDLLLPAFDEARQHIPKMKLLLAGGGDSAYKDWIVSEIARLELEEHVSLLGFLDNPGKWDALSRCDMLVAPSYTESFSMSAVEAMAAGKPVIISDQVAIHDVIAEAQAGLIVPCDVHQLAQAIWMLAADADVRRVMGTRGRQLVEAQFAAGQMGRSLLDCYQRYGSGK